MRRPGRDSFRRWLGVLWLVSSVSASGPVAPTIRTHVDVDRIRVGDPITLTVTVEAPADFRIVFPGEELDLNPFSVLDRSHRASERGDGRIEESLVLTVSAYETGDLGIPSFSIVINGQDQRTDELKTDAVPIRVETVLTGNDTQPRAIKDPIGYEAAWRYKVYVIGTVLALGIGLTALLVWFRRRRRMRAQIAVLTPPPPRPADAIALEELERLRGEDLPGRGLTKEYCVRLTDIFKRYITARYAIPTVERTTGEIRRDLSESMFGETDRRDILHVLEQADLVKFARFEPPTHALFDLFQVVESFILRTRESRIVLSNPGEDAA